MTRVVNWIDRRVLHPSLRNGDSDRLRRARLLVLLTGLLALPNVVFTSFFLLSGEIVQGLGSGIIGVSYFGGLLLVRRRGTIETATHFIAGPLILVTIPQVFVNGGIMSLAVWPWLLIGVMLAFLLGGARVGRVWAAVLFGAVAVAIADVFVHPPDASIENIEMSVFSVVFLSMMSIGIVVMYERLKDHMVASLRGAYAHSRLVLDNIGDGFLLVRPDGTLTPERSAVTEHWFGMPEPNVRLWDWLVEDDNERLRMELGWEELVADIMPRELLLDQMPKRLARGTRTWSLQYCVVGGDELEAMVVVVRDITLALVALRAEDEKAEQMQLFELLARDPEGFRAFLRDAQAIVAGLASSTEVVRHRLLHTLKGNAAQVGALSVASICHQIEDRLAEGDALTGEDTAELARRLDVIHRRFGALVAAPVDAVQIDERDVAALRAALRRRASIAELEALVDSWGGDGVHQRLGRIAEQARGLGSRLGRGELDVEVRAEAIHCAHGQLDALFASFSHLVRNAVDHGLEARDERLRCGKPANGALRLTAEQHGDRVVFTVVDDGRGVDWNRVRARALERGLPTATMADLVDALFVDGLSTRDAVSEISGRGVGMSAVKQAVCSLGGEVRVDSTLGSGTIVTIALPFVGNFLGHAPEASPAAAVRAQETLVPQSL